VGVRVDGKWIGHPASPINVMAGYSRAKNSVASPAYVLAIHAFLSNVAVY
jgi:hypothetical protein